MKMSAPSSPVSVNHLTRSFLISVGLLLAVTASAKIFTVFAGEAQALERPDAIFWFLTNRQLMLTVALLELSVGGVVLSTRFGMRSKLGLIAWLGMLFMIYRFGFSLVGLRISCGCMGHVPEILGIGAGAVGLGLKIMLGYLFIGSVALLAAQSLSLKEISSRTSQGASGLSRNTHSPPPTTS